MTTETLLAAAKALHAAETALVPIPQFAQTAPDLSPDDAYEIQRLGAELKLAAGARQLGYKIGMTNAAAQAGMKTDEPVYGRLMDDFAYADGDDIATRRIMVPRVEMELAFVLAQPLAGAKVTVDDVLAATAYVAPALELCAFRTLTPRTLIDTIADNCASSGIVTSASHEKPGSFDLAAVRGVLSINGQVAAEGVSEAVLGHPAAAVAWLVRKLASQGLGGLQPGQTVLSGAFVGPVGVKLGDEVSADFGDLGTIEIRFA